MAKTIAKLNVMLTATTAQFGKGMDAAGMKVKSFAERTNRLVIGIGSHLRAALQRGLIAVTALAAGLVYLTKKTGDAIDAQAKMARRLGLTYNQLKAIELAAGLAGISSDKLNTAFEKMLDTVGSAQFGEGAAIQAFENIGISIDQLNQMDPASQFNAIAAAINNIQDPSQRLAAARDIFGRSGGALVELFAGGASAIEAANAKLELFGITLSSLQTANIEDMNDRLTESRLIFDGIGSQIAAKISPYISQLAVDTQEWLASMGGVGAVTDMAFAGIADMLDRISEKITPIVNWMERIWEVMKAYASFSPIRGVGFGARLIGDSGVIGMLGSGIDKAFGINGDSDGPTFADRYRQFKSKAESRAAERGATAQAEEQRQAQQTLEDEQRTVNADAIEQARQRRMAEQAGIYYNQFGQLPPGMQFQSGRQQAAPGDESISLLRQIAINTGQQTVGYAG